MNYDERVCRLCNVPEDECHYCLIECPMYDECRAGCLPKTLLRRLSRSLYEFVKFFKSDCVIDSGMLATLCVRVTKEHERLMIFGVELSGIQRIVDYSRCLVLGFVWSMRACGSACVLMCVGKVCVCL